MASIHTRNRKDGSIVYRVAFRIDGRQAQESFDDPSAALHVKELCDRVGGRAAREWLLDRESDDEEMPVLAEFVE